MKLTANLFAALAVLLAAQTASAQSTYPNRPVKILVGFTPGTAPDLAARILADRFSEVWGTPFVVENIPGAGSNIATDRVAKAAADGYTLLMGGNPSLVISPSLYETLPFDPLRDFAAISQVFIAANVLAVPPELPVKTVAELVALAKAEPGKLSYGHAGVGTSQHLGAELFKYMAHVDIAPVPYRGTTALLPDLLANRISMSFANIVNVVPLAREGKLRALAITSIKRSRLSPDLPTMAESGFPGWRITPSAPIRLRAVALVATARAAVHVRGHSDEVVELPELHHNLPCLAGMGPAYKVVFKLTAKGALWSGSCPVGRAHRDLAPSERLAAIAGPRLCPTTTNVPSEYYSGPA
jgi:tripartite-type tricarboxylate transporter receptor subunit TctC